MIIYYVGAHLSAESAAILGELKRPHVTIAYSRKWFPYKQGKFYPLVIEPPFWQEQFGILTVLRFQSSRLFERHIELRNAGATWDFEGFKAHITTRTLLDQPLVLESEYYGTWEE